MTRITIEQTDPLTGAALRTDTIDLPLPKWGDPRPSGEAAWHIIPEGEGWYVRWTPLEGMENIYWNGPTFKNSKEVLEYAYFNNPTARYFGPFHLPLSPRQVLR